MVSERQIANALTGILKKLDSYFGSRGVESASPPYSGDVQTRLSPLARPPKSIEVKRYYRDVRRQAKFNQARASGLVLAPVTVIEAPK